MAGQGNTKKRNGRARETALPQFIILIDQEPLRRSAAADCTATVARLDHARAGRHRFEREDKPAFARWRAREFGALLSEAREVEVRITEHQALVHEVENEMRRGFQNAHSAYQRVMYQRANPHLVEEPVAVPRAETSGATRPLSEFEKEALFQEWVQKSLGTNPDKMDDEAYSTTFEVFKSNMFRAPRDEPRPADVQRAAPRERAAPEREEEVADEPLDLRVKELYRVLVRRLHPDLRADGSAAVSALWHEVQESYAAGDVAQLEILLALCEIESNHMSASTSLSQIHALHAELERALRALEKSLLEAEGEDAWNFARAGEVPGLRLRVERELKANLAQRVTRLNILTQTIADWARGPAANRKAARDRQFA